jgi:hypothetical protein
VFIAPAYAAFCDGEPLWDIYASNEAWEALSRRQAAVMKLAVESGKNARIRRTSQDKICIPKTNGKAN